MIDFTWKVFSQTGNVETYLLLKEIETELELNEQVQHQEGNLSRVDTTS